VVALGEVMARLETPGCGRFQQALPGVMDVTFAGAEASVAASIAYLGGDAAFVSALPEHAIADACVADLRSLGVQIHIHIHVIRRIKRVLKNKRLRRSRRSKNKKQKAHHRLHYIGTDSHE